MTSIHNGNGMLTAQFSAFTKLTLVNRFKNNHDGIKNSTQQSMNFQEFSEALNSNTPISTANARDLPKSEQRDSDLNTQNGGNANYQRERLTFIQHAYQLGMVDSNGLLISLPNSNSTKLRETMIQAYENSF